MFSILISAKKCAWFYLTILRKEYQVNERDCIAQMILEWCKIPKFAEVLSDEKLPSTEKDSKSFGSSSI